MRIKKILSLAVVLAMVLTVVPMFGLTAGAAEGNTLVLIDTTKISTDVKGDIDLSTCKYAEPYYKVSYGKPIDTDAICVKYNTQWDIDGDWNTQEESGAPAVMFFRAGARDNGKNEIQSLIFDNAEMTKGADKITVEYQFAAQVVGNNYQTWTFRDADGTAFARVFTDIGDGNAEIQFGGPLDAYNRQDEAKSYITKGSREDVKNARGKTFTITAEKQGDGNYSVKYSVDGQVIYPGEEDEPQNISMNGIGSIESYMEKWNNQYAAMAMMGLKVSVEFPGNITVADVTYTAGGKTVDKISVPVTDGNGTAPANSYRENGSDKFYHVEETQITRTTTVEMKEIQPDNAAESKITAVNGKTYTINQKNLIPNGDFKYGVAGWYNGKGQPAESTFFTVNSDEDAGTVTPAISTGDATECCFTGSFPIEDGKTYILKSFIKNLGASDPNYIRASLSNTIGGEDFSIYGKGGGSSIPGYDNTVAGEEKAYAFKNTGNYKYLVIRNRWSTDTYGKFGLYEAADNGTEAKTVETEISEQFIVDGNNPVGLTNVVKLADGASIQIEMPEKYETGSSVTVYDRLTGDEYSVPANLTVWPCTDDSLAGQTINNSHGEGVSDGFQHNLGMAVKSKAYVQFDVTYNVAPSDTNDIISILNGAEVFGKDVFAMQTNTANKVGFRTSNSGWDGNYLTVTKGTTYRVNATIDLPNHKYQVTVLNPDGTEGCKTGDMTYRGGDITQISRLYVHYNVKDGKNDRVTVKNFRISAEGVTEREVPIKDDTGSQTVDNYKFMGYEDSTTTVPAGIYGTQYYIDNAVENVTIAEGTTAKKLTLFDWDFNKKAAGKAYKYDTYNSGQVEFWEAKNHETYAYVDVPENADNKKYIIKIKGKWTSGINNSISEQQSNAPGIGIDVIERSELEQIDLRQGNKAEAALAAIKGTSLTENEGENRFVPIPEGYVDVNTECTVAYIVPDDKASALKAGKAALRLHPTRRGSLSVSNIEIVAVTEPEKVTVTPSLGYDDDSLTIDFTLSKALDENTKVEIVREDGTALTPVTSVNAKENTVINLSTGNSNAIYTATVKTTVEGADFVVGEAKTSLYKLVVDDISTNNGKYTKGAQVNSDRIKMAADVITKGGVYFGEDGNLLSEVSDILTKDNGESENEIIITVDGTLFGLGIGFVVKNGDTVYFGSEKEGTVSDTNETEALYDKMTINTENNTIKFENVATQEAITLSLDSVNIEFIETLIEEAEADGADAEADFIPEL